ncbi:MAG TPA: SNF2-related protein, partial [Polyangiaceae bacterium]
MATLTKALATYTERRVQARGEQYYGEGRVRFTQAHANELVGEAHGTLLYSVVLRFDAGTLDVYCDCPYSEIAVCKHVWAAARLADDLDYFGSYPQPRRLALLADPDDSSSRLWAHELPPISGVSHVYAASSNYDAATQALMLRHGPAPSEDVHRWRGLLSSQPHPALARSSEARDEIWYVVNPGLGSMNLALGACNELELHPMRRKRRKDGTLGAATPLRRPPSNGELSALEALVWDLGHAGFDGVATLSDAAAQRLLPELCATGRVAVLDEQSGELVPLSFDAGEPWRLVIELAARDDQIVECTGQLVRHENAGETLALARVTPLGQELVVADKRIARLSPGSSKWLHAVCEAPLLLRACDVPDFLVAVTTTPDGPALGDLEGVGFTTARGKPVPTLRLEPSSARGRTLHGTLVFSYGKGLDLGAESGAQTLLDRRRRRLLLRDYEAELAAINLLETHQCVLARSAAEADGAGTRAFRVSVGYSEFTELADELLQRGWRLEAMGQRYRRASQFGIIVESGQDWLDVKGSAHYDGTAVELPRLLLAVRKQERWVRLDDGSFGLLPKEWLERLDALSELSDPKNGTLRVRAMQALLLDAALAAVPKVERDAGFSRLVESLRGFVEVEPLDEPKGFAGKLRGYQRRALGWLDALDRLELGGCLADDMGLGKTVVVLAWLLHRKTRRDGARRRRRPAAPRASLVVVPRSLLFNWQRECARFTPALRLLVHHGAERGELASRIEAHDIVLTSYGTLRRDIEALQQLDFDYVVLDEAHNIKNPETTSHRAARTLRSRRRLTLTGTPVENHLGELLAQLTFLNPGLFERLKHVQKAFERKRPSQTALESTIRTAVKPFVLRRTKEEVAKDLPERFEHTIYVQQSAAERKLYAELAEYYKQRLLQRRKLRQELGPSKNGNNAGRAAAEMLEALLRLRQAACHPGLIDETLRGQSSAKLDRLVTQLLELRSTGHKALVFSQFTQLLGVLGEQLTDAGVPFAYLDGKTRDREAAVHRFQDDPECGVFLKAVH